MYCWEENSGILQTHLRAGTNEMRLGSSLAERRPEEASVVSSILTRGTTAQLFFTSFIFWQKFCFLQKNSFRLEYCAFPQISLMYCWEENSGTPYSKFLVHEILRLWFNGRTIPCQGMDRGSIPLSRSTKNISCCEVFFVCTFLTKQHFFAQGVKNALVLTCRF
jgi:hypothetical protein